MKRLLLFAVVSLLAVMLARTAAAQEVSARALLAFQQYRYGDLTTSGFRQTYDLRLERALTMTSLVRLLVRGDDFRGSQQFAALPQASNSRQIQPVGEFILNTTNLHAQMREELLDIKSRNGDVQSTRRINRLSGQMLWEPDRLPTLTLLGQRNETNDDASTVRLTEDNALGTLGYSWHDLHVDAGERYNRSSDPLAGYDRKMSTHVADASYSASRWGGKLAVTAEGSAQLAHIDESAAAGTSSIPSPVAIGRALYGVDDTPADDRDHPLAVYPSLIDGSTNAPTGINLGPDAVSFQNLAIDLARIDRVDEIRVLVRDGGGNPMRNGGGPVTWDAYTSQDGLLWTPLASQTSFNAALSLYSITFDVANGRWFKVVNFGVNVETTVVTELQAYYHTTIAPGQQRTSTQNFYVGTTNVTSHPNERLTLAYTASFSAIRQNFATQANQSSSDIEHIAEVQYDPRRWLSLRGQYLKRDGRTLTGSKDSVDGITTYFDWIPTRQLRTSLELSRQTQTLEGSVFTIDTEALHTTAFLLKSLFFTFDVGTQRQTFTADASTAQRRYATMTGNVQLLPSLRVLLNGTLQTNDTQSSDPAAQLLGPSRDNRLSADFLWRAGRPLAISASFGHVSGQQLSGFTQRYHVEWYPFADGTVSLASAYDHDIDPVSNRRATRMVINPRWVMNRFVMFDINYTAVSTTFSSFSNRQRTLFATLTLTK
jgi:hypothetical protein